LRTLSFCIIYLLIGQKVAPHCEIYWHFFSYEMIP
jgi:hypothetical protein